MFFRYWKRTQLCEFCLANWMHKCAIPELCWGDFSETAPWWLTEFNHTAYLLTERQISPWSFVPGWSLHQNIEDLMHDYHEGVGRDLVASVIFELVHEQARATGESIDDNLVLLTKEMKLWCKAHTIKFPCRSFTTNSVGGMKSTEFQILGGPNSRQHT